VKSNSFFIYALLITSGFIFNCSLGYSKAQTDPNLIRDVKTINRLIRTYTKKNISVISKDKIMYNKNKLYYKDDYWNDINGSSNHYPFCQYMVKNQEYHIAAACISPLRDKSYLVILKKKNNAYSLLKIVEYYAKDLFVCTQLERGELNLYVIFESDTDYHDIYIWNGKKYNKLKFDN
jgi:hypothetical protein